MRKVQERFHRRMERKRASSADQQRRSSSAAVDEQQRINHRFGGANRRQSTTSTLGEERPTNLLSPEMAALNIDKLSENSENKKQNKSIRKRVNSWFGQTSQEKDSDENLMNLTPDQLEIAELGKPRLGEFRKCQITIKESKDFQVEINYFF
uniref:Uncharacterized protein n=1 Tax=Meloidogyne hapla TaxID=6305 RepID=A0A1I8B0J3_MELHA